MSPILRLIFLFVIACGVFAWTPAQAAPAQSRATSDEEEEAALPTEMPGYSSDDLRKLADKVQRTGVGSDQIPALFRPHFLSIADADLSMDNDEVVFIVHYPDNRVRIYPRRVLVWHEVVNDVLPDSQGELPLNVPGLSEPDGENYTVSYSPLTGSVVAFRSQASRYASSFGVSGNLLNGNSVLYDRISRSLWSQLLATCIEGPFRGKRLQRIPIIAARWKGVKHRYGGLDSAFTGTAEVLSRSTGFKRSYGKDPYGSYEVPGTYYDDNRLPFPVDSLDTRLPPKKRILGIEVDNAFGAVQKDAVRESRVLNFTLGIVPMMAAHDQEIDAVRVFDRKLPDREQALTFVIFEEKLLDEQTKSEWTADGVCVQGPLRGRRLSPVLAVDSMWFAWASFYRGTRIFPGSSF
ncbi:MAG: DUF3179 domain-containing protein [Desulfovibrio sp.]|jgi:hypothetical protein|nr:DUF3179 domain-containing protein [Desulfovibrio sp.]